METADRRMLTIAGRYLPAIVGFASLLLAGGLGDSNATLTFPLRTRVEAFKGSSVVQEARIENKLPIPQTAVLICDMWDHHWCSGSEKRVGILAPKIAAVIKQARARGLLIIHAPSETMSFYKDYPQRQRMLEVPKVEPPAPLELADPPLPIDDSGGGCETGERGRKPYPWTRQHAAIPMAADDVISDQGPEIYSLLAQRGIKNVLIMGVHTNKCILNRTFAIKQMTRWGVRCILVRDLTDSMYDPQKRPFVSHDEGTELVVQYIERYWCPTTHSPDLLRALQTVR
jgi:nicotinamidase-related amidase